MRTTAVADDAAQLSTSAAGDAAEFSTSAAGEAVQASISHQSAANGASTAAAPVANGAAEHPGIGQAPGAAAGEGVQLGDGSRLGNGAAARGSDTGSSERHSDPQRSRQRPADGALRQQGRCFREMLRKRALTASRDVRGAVFTLLLPILAVAAVLVSLPFSYTSTIYLHLCDCVS